ncbi:MAG: metal ABC transporter substrate-binding protein [Solirubrobacterales bacterium]
MNPRASTAAVPILAIALLLAVAVAACGSDDDGGGAPRVAATTGILADIAGEVAGDDAEVVQLIPDGSSPHDFQLSAEDRAEVEDSVLLAYNGADLEAGVPVDELDLPRFALADNVGPLLESTEAGAHEEEHAAEEEEHAHEGGDPHVWMDPSRTAAALPALAEALAQADPEHADGYRRRADEYADELRALDTELADRLATIPAGDRELVTSHDALGYFADRYGLEVVATPFPASGAEAEPSASHLRESTDAIRSAGVPAVFAEAGDDPEVLELIAGDTGVEVVDDLLVESPGDSGGYVEMLRHDAGLIATGLGGSEGG